MLIQTPYPQGRNLALNDQLVLSESCGPTPSELESRATGNAFRVPESIRPQYPDEHELTVIAGPQADTDYLTEEGLNTFFGVKWKVRLVLPPNSASTGTIVWRGILWTRSAPRAIGWASVSKVQNSTGLTKTEAWAADIRAISSTMDMRMGQSMSYVFYSLATLRKYELILQLYL